MSADFLMNVYYKKMYTELIDILYVYIHFIDQLTSEATAGGVIKKFTKFTGKHLYWSLFFNKVGGLRSGTLLKKRLQHGCLPMNFAKF